MAQRLAQATHNRLVVGSNPTGPTFNLRFQIDDFRLWMDDLCRAGWRHFVLT